MSKPSLLANILCAVPRRYRLPAVMRHPAENTSPSTMLAAVIEQARQAMVDGDAPDVELKRLFVQALAQMIRDAMRTESGDPVFQAMVLRHGAVRVREYVSLTAQADQDRRVVLGQVNAIAHPGKQQGMAPGWQRDAMAQLHAAAWSELADTARRILALPQMESKPAFRDGVTRLLNNPELERLQRLDVLAHDEQVRQYQALLDKQGPRPGSRVAVAQGAVSQQRGAAVELQTAKAFQTLASALNTYRGQDGKQEHEQGSIGNTPYRVVTSMRVPALLASGIDYAKTEWDVVLLRQANTVDATTIWDVCLFAEAKASVDAATTDFSRLLRGLQLLAQAEEHTVYPFQTQEGTVHVSGASLRALTTRLSVLYSCDADADASPRLLNAANRMRLFGDQTCLDFATRLVNKQDTDPDFLEPVWQQVLESPRWHAVLNQYPLLQRVRELMIHPDDLVTTVDSFKSVDKRKQDP